MLQLQLLASRECCTLSTSSSIIPGFEGTFLMRVMVYIQKVKAPEELELISTLASGDPHEHVIFIFGLMAVAERSLMQVIGLASGCSSAQTVSQL